jgi:hypothetical protein
MWPCSVTNIFIIKPTSCINFPNLLRLETLHGTSWSCSKAVYRPVWHIPVPSVQWINSWWWAEELPETCRVSCRSKFGKLVHLVGFIIKKSTYMFFFTVSVQNNFTAAVWNKKYQLIILMCTEYNVYGEWNKGTQLTLLWWVKTTFPSAGTVLTSDFHNIVFEVYTENKPSKLNWRW